MTPFRIALMGVLSVIAFTAQAQAVCSVFNHARELPAVPIIARGTVIESTAPEVLSSCEADGPERCRYRFTIEVSDVLRGKVPAHRISFEYGYYEGCPGVDVFSIGTTQVWLLRSVEADGNGQLNGVSCGRGFISNNDAQGLEALQRVISTSN